MSSETDIKSQTGTASGEEAAPSEDGPENGPESTPKTKPVRKRRWGRFGLWSVAMLICLGALAGVGVLALTGRTITAPDWLHDEIEARASAAISGGSVSFGVAEFVVNEGWRPRVRVQDLRLQNLQGVEVVKFSEAESSLAMRPLLRGEIMPKTVRLSGVFATLQRSADGALSLRGGADLTGGLGQTRPSEASGATLPELIGTLDRALDQSALRALVSAEIQSLTLRYEDLRAQDVWVVDGGRLRLNRNGDDLQLSADLALLSGGADVATLEANYGSKIGATSAEFGVNIFDVRARDIASQNPALAWLKVLRAPISGALRSGVRADGSLAPLSATLQIGAGVLQPTDQTKPVPFDSARSYFTYDPAQQVIDFAELSLASEWVTARAEGRADLAGLDRGIMTELVGQFRLSDLSFSPADLYETPVLLEGADMDFQLRLDPFELRLGQMQIRDQGQSLVLKGNLKADTEGWDYALDAQMNAITPERLLALWPARAVPGTRNWILENLKAGALHNLDAALRGAPGQKPNIYASFDYTGATVRYSPNLPPVEEGAGHANLLDNRFVVAVDAGHVVAPQGGRVDVAGSSFIIPDVTVVGGPPSVARLRSSGTVTAALALLNLPPLSVMDRAKLPETLADGRAVLEGTLAIPLKKGLKGADIRYRVQGTLQDISTDTLVEGETLAANSLSLKASQDGIEIAGQGRLGALPFDVVWAQPLGAEAGSGSTLRGTVELSERTIDQFNIGLPPGSLRGRAVGEISIDLPPGRDPVLRLSSNLRGLNMGFAPLGWSKTAQAAGTLDMTLTLSDPVRVDAITLDAPGLFATGDIVLNDGGGLDRVRLRRVQAGRWLDAPVTLVGRGPGAAPRIEVTGGSLDLRTAEFGGGGGGRGGASAQSGPLTLALDRLQVTDTMALTNMRGTFDTQGGLDGNFTARVNGGPLIRGRVLPQNGRSAVRILGDDAGGVFASAGLLKQARGGDLSLTLLPVGSGGAFDGKLTVKSTRVQDAPAIAALLNALSIVGLLEQMGGSGIHFQEIEADFRLTPSTMTLTQASAVGPSMGISMDGVYAVDSGTLDMRGVVSPLYLVNGIGSLFTRKGEGLIGFNYNISGSAENPRVQVNPLSALTPGMFRNIFRAPPPQLPDVAGAGAETPQALRTTGDASPEKPRRQPNVVESR